MIDEEEMKLTSINGEVAELQARYPDINVLETFETMAGALANMMKPNLQTGDVAAACPVIIGLVAAQFLGYIIPQSTAKTQDEIADIALLIMSEIGTTALDNGLSLASSKIEEAGTLQ